MAPSTITETVPGTLKLVSETKPQHNVQESSQPSTEKTPLEAISHGMVMPGIPTFPSHAAERRHMLTHMAATFRFFARSGFTEGQSGHISVRDPEHAGLMWMNPLGRHFGMLRAGDMVCLEIATGRVAGGNPSRPANAAGYHIHAAIHRRRPDVHAVCHAHTHAGRAWSVFARPLDMLNQDICNFHNAHAVYGQYGGIAFEADEGAAIAASLGTGNKGAILLNHGLLTVGRTVDEAGFMFGLLDRGCAMQLQVEAAAASGGLKKHVISDAEAAENFRMASEPHALYREAQPDLEFEFEAAGGEDALAAGFEALSPLVP
ncbi:arad-like aldolase/epimerase [Xylariomycetidae sp. FL0641]|nr:arad-like aldolase/epimerase [Xylariomycetidae sp. FL0641]